MTHTVQWNTRSRGYIFYNKKKYKLPTITKLLFEREDIIVSRQGVARVLKIYKETGTIDRRHGTTVRLQQTVLCQQISTPLLKTSPMYINKFARLEACSDLLAVL